MWLTSKQQWFLQLLPFQEKNNIDNARLEKWLLKLWPTFCCTIGFGWPCSSLPRHSVAREDGNSKPQSWAASNVLFSGKGKSVKPSSHIIKKGHSYKVVWYTCNTMHLPPWHVDCNRFRMACRKKARVWLTDCEISSLVQHVHIWLYSSVLEMSLFFFFTAMQQGGVFISYLCNNIITI